MESLINKGGAAVQSPATFRRTSNPVSPLAANIPCNEKGTDYKTLANQTLAALMSEAVNFDEDDVDSSIAIDSWRSITKKGGVNLYFKIDKFTKQRILLSTTVLKCNLYDALELVRDAKLRNGYDSLIKENYELEAFDDTTTFNYCTLQSKACLVDYSIDICYLSTFREINSQHILGFTSILDHPKAPSTANIKRSWLYSSGYILEPIPDQYNEIKVYFLVHADLRIEDLPVTLKNKLLEKHALSLIQMKQTLEDPNPIRKPTWSNLQLNEPENLNDSVFLTAEKDRLQESPSPSAKIREDPLNWNFLSNTGNTETDYITMGNSTTASLFREYINMLEALRFSSTHPEKFNWRVVETKTGVWIMEKMGSTIQCMAGVANINASEAEITNFISNPRNRFTFDPTLHKTYVIEEVNQDINIIYGQYKAKHCFIGLGREFVYFQYMRKEGDKRIIAHSSCSHPSAPEGDKIVRSTMYDTGFIIEPLTVKQSGLCSVTYIVKVDLKGNIPESLVRWIKRRQPKILIGIKNYFEK